MKNKVTFKRLVQQITDAINGVSPFIHQLETAIKGKELDNLDELQIHLKAEAPLKKKDASYVKPNGTEVAAIIPRAGYDDVCESDESESESENEITQQRINRHVVLNLRSGKTKKLDALNPLYDPLVIF